MGAAPHAPIQPVDAMVVRGSGISCGFYPILVFLQIDLNMKYATV